MSRTYENNWWVVGIDGHGAYIHNEYFTIANDSTVTFPTRLGHSMTVEHSSFKFKIFDSFVMFISLFLPG